MVVLKLALLTKSASASCEEIRALFRIRVEDEGLEAFVVFSFSSTFISPLCALPRILTLSLVLVLLVLGPLVPGVLWSSAGGPVGNAGLRIATWSSRGRAQGLQFTLGEI